MTTAALLAAGDTCMRVSDEEIMAVLFVIHCLHNSYIHTLEQITGSLSGIVATTIIDFMFIH